MFHFKSYDRKGRIRKPVIIMYSLFSIWQMVVMWMSSTTGYITDGALLKMPVSVNYTGLAYGSLFVSAVVFSFFPEYCLRFCRILGVLASLCVFFCFFYFDLPFCNVLYCILTICAASLTAAYVVVMISMFTLRDIWLENLAEIFFIGLFSLILLNGKYEIPFKFYNAVSFVSLLLCTISYFLLEEKNTDFTDFSGKKPPHRLLIFLGFTAFFTMFALTITTPLSLYIRNANIFLFSGQILTVFLLIFLERKTGNLYSVLSICAFISTAGLVLISCGFMKPLACFLLGTASSMSVTGMLIAGYAFSRYKSRFIAPAAVIVSGLATGGGQILYNLLKNRLTFYYIIMIGIYVIFIISYEFFVPVIEYRSGYGSMQLNHDSVLYPGIPAVKVGKITDTAEETVHAAVVVPVAEELSRREYEVVNLILSGYTATQIAAALFISLNTVKTHTKNIYSKLGINSKKELFELMRKKN
jgi:DNA-binding CsgD family transcriptional regulator